MSASPSSPSPTVRQLRLVVHAEDYETALVFYRDTLGLPEQAALQGAGGARVAILDAGRATLKLANSAQKRFIDAVEAGGRPSRTLRVALQVDDAVRTSEHLVQAGATLVAAARYTPWRSLNARLHAPGNLELTLFQEPQD